MTPANEQSIVRAIEKIADEMGRIRRVVEADSRKRIGLAQDADDESLVDRLVRRATDDRIGR